jgi:peptidoglycan/xylan/chitin deacetylase (PgdA/CDA1 family)
MIHPTQVLALAFRPVRILFLFVLLFSAPALKTCAATVSAYAPTDTKGAKWNEIGWIDDTYFPWVYSYAHSNWFYVYGGTDADTTHTGYWLFYYTPDCNAYGWGYVAPGHGWWCLTLDSTCYWLKFGDSLPADGKVLRVALMFDDGPSANTDRLLSELASAGVKANFDLIGTNCEANPDKVKAIYNAGHEINNHGYQHLEPSTLTDAQLTSEIVDCETAVKNITGEAPKWFWPPDIALDSRQPGILSANGMGMCVVTTIDNASDHDTTVSEDTIKSVTIANAKDGSIVLLHEWRDASVDAVPYIIAQLRAKGCVFLRYDEIDAYLRAKGY